MVHCSDVVPVMYFTQPHCAYITRFNTPEIIWWDSLWNDALSGAPIGQRQRTKFSIYGLFATLIPSNSSHKVQLCRADAHCRTVSALEFTGAVYTIMERQHWSWGGIKQHERPKETVTSHREFQEVYFILINSYKTDYNRRSAAL